MPLSDPVVSGYLVTLDDLTLAWAKATLPFPILDPGPIITPEYPDGAPDSTVPEPHPARLQLYGQLFPRPLALPVPQVGEAEPP
jgi:hypothetical protein